MHTLKQLLLVFIISQCLASECYDYTRCEWVCTHLANCENSWLAGADKAEMTDDEFDIYVNDCIEDCDGASPKYVDCVGSSTCRQLYFGECR